MQYRKGEVQTRSFLGDKVFDETVLSAARVLWKKIKGGYLFHVGDRGADYSTHESWLEYYSDPFFEQDSLKNYLAFAKEEKVKDKDIIAYDWNNSGDYYPLTFKEFVEHIDHFGRWCSCFPTVEDDVKETFRQSLINMEGP